MDKQYFFLKLNPRRADFAQTMTDEERAIMQQHVAYWKRYLNEGKVIVYGPVFDPKGNYGIGIVAVDSEEEVQQLIAHDPAATINTYEYHAMRAVLPE